MRSKLGEHRPDYTFICGVCKRIIKGKSNTVHLGIKNHIMSEYKQGKREEPYTSPNKYGDRSLKFV